MNTKYQYLSAWSGLVFTVVFFIGWWVIAGYVPPISPELDAQAVAAFYINNNTQIKVGLTVAMFSMILLVPFMALITLQMARIEGRWPILTLINALSCVINMAYFVIPLGIWNAAAFRPEQAAETIQIFNDFGWMFILWPVSLTTLQNGVFGLCILSDKRATPLMPRWSGYLTIFIAIMVIPGGLIPFFKTGPFAWDGILAFWLVATTYFIWMIIMSFVLHKSVTIAAAEEPIV